MKKIIEDCFKRKEIPLCYFLMEEMKKSNFVSSTILYKSTFYNTNKHKKTYVFYKRIK